MRSRECQDAFTSLSSQSSCRCHPHDSRRMRSAVRSRGREIWPAGALFRREKNDGGFIDPCARPDRSPIAVERRRSMLALRMLKVVYGDPIGVRSCGCDLVCNVQPTTRQAGMATTSSRTKFTVQSHAFCSPRAAFYFSHLKCRAATPSHPTPMTSYATQPLAGTSAREPVEPVNFIRDNGGVCAANGRHCAARQRHFW